MKRSLLNVASLLAFTVFTSSSLFAAPVRGWLDWRGPQHLGVSLEKGLPDKVDAKVKAKVSVMPEGLFKDLTLEEIADLFAFLETSKNNPEPAPNVAAAPGDGKATPPSGGE